MVGGGMDCGLDDDDDGGEVLVLYSLWGSPY